ncbi:hypothetical protein [Kocuria sp. U4B]
MSTNNHTAPQGDVNNFSSTWAVPLIVAAGFILPHILVAVMGL